MGHPRWVWLVVGTTLALFVLCVVVVNATVGPSPSVKDHIDYTWSGTGSETSQTFHMSTTWAIAYAFKCSTWGNFIVDSRPDHVAATPTLINPVVSPVLVNLLGTKGTGTTTPDRPVSTLRLEVKAATGCSWRIEVINVSG